MRAHFDAYAYISRKSTFFLLQKKTASGFQCSSVSALLFVDHYTLQRVNYKANLFQANRSDLRIYCLVASTDPNKTKLFCLFGAEHFKVLKNSKKQVLRNYCSSASSRLLPSHNFFRRTTGTVLIPLTNDF